jgi:hypothetical protein
MKFAHSSPQNGRGQMHERQRRARAVTAPLRTQFPEFDSLRLEFGFSDEGPFTPVPQVTVMHPAARAYFVFPCPYSHCDGEFDLSAAINAMAHAEQANCQGRLQCSGHRTRDNKGRSACGLTLEYLVQAQRA